MPWLMARFMTTPPTRRPSKVSIARSLTGPPKSVKNSTTTLHTEEVGVKSFVTLIIRRKWKSSVSTSKVVGAVVVGEGVGLLLAGERDGGSVAGDCDGATVASGGVTSMCLRTSLARLNDGALSVAGRR